MMGEMVQMAGNTEHTGYLAVPDTGVGPGVLVLHAWWGLNDFFKSVCDRLAAEGFVAFAPDLYGGKMAETIDEASQLREASEFGGIREVLVAGVRFLVRRPEVRPIGIGMLGFSMGAAWALELAAERPGTVKAVVLFYGAWIPENLPNAQAAFLGHFGPDDEWEPLEGVNALETALKEAGRTVAFHTYPGVGHWFFEANRPDDYAQEAAQLAWERTLAFLRGHLAEELDPLPRTSEEFIGRIEGLWAELQSTWAGLTPEEMTRPGPDGWSVKDHLAHITTWENFLLRSEIEGEAAEAVTGLDGETLASIDASNEALVRRAREKSLQEVLAESRVVHEAVVAELKARPLESWMQPRFPDDPDEQPLIMWIAGNTWGHYAEHIAWIKRLLDLNS